jgi:hypothetical protein
MYRTIVRVALATAVAALSPNGSILVAETVGGATIVEL